MLTAGVRTIKLFTVVIYLFPSQMFESKDGAYPSGGLNDSAHSFACKYKTKVRLNDRDKHASLLWHGINYDCKKVWSTYHRVGEPA